MSWHRPILIRVFSFEETLCFSISFSMEYTAKTQRTQQIPMLIWVFALCTWFSDAFVQMRSHLVSSYIGQLLLCPIFQRTIFPENMYKIGTFLIWWVGYFPDQTFYWGKDLLYEDNMLFHGPFVDNLGSVLILRGSRILYYTTGKFTQKPELHKRQKQQ